MDIAGFLNLSCSSLVVATANSFVKESILTKIYHLHITLTPHNRYRVTNFYIKILAVLYLVIYFLFIKKH